jgi:AcrR family transcriptional regulator
MRATSEVAGRAERTFIENARRSQIVGSAIDTIAEVGYRAASFAKIAQRADISSTGLISYHFAGRRDLIEQVVLDIYTMIAQFMDERMQGIRTASAALRTYILAQVEFIATHRTQMKALFDIFISGEFHYDATAERGSVTRLEEILRDGTQKGEFRAFDIRVLAVTITQSIEGLPLVLQSYPDIDLDSYGQELATLFDLATRKAL